MPMKRLIKILAPCLLMLILIYLLRDGKDILAGLFIYFPIIYIGIGVACADLKKELIWCLLLTSAAFMVPVNLMFNMGSCIDLLIIYLALGSGSYFIKRLVQKRKNKY